jgi:glycerate 2-kinase
MIIENFDSLASTPLRKQALLIAEAGLQAVAVPRVMAAQVKYDSRKQVLTVRNQNFPIKGYNKIFILGFGPGSSYVVNGLDKSLNQQNHVSFSLDSSFGVAYPNCSSANTLATRELINLLSQVSDNDLVIIISTASDILCAPVNISCEQQEKVFSGLRQVGASAEELDIVRNHMSLVHGGGLAKACYPAKVINVVFGSSDNDLLKLDPTTTNDALKLLRKYHTLDRANLDTSELIETPKEQKYFENINTVFLASTQDLVKAAEQKAEELGWRIGSGACLVKVGSLQEDFLVSSDGMSSKEVMVSCQIGNQHSLVPHGLIVESDQQLLEIFTDNDSMEDLFKQTNSWINLDFPGPTLQNLLIRLRS